MSEWTMLDGTQAGYAGTFKTPVCRRAAEEYPDDLYERPLRALDNALRAADEKTEAFFRHAERSGTDSAAAHLRDTLGPAGVLAAGKSYYSPALRLALAAPDPEDPDLADRARLFFDASPFDMAYAFQDTEASSLGGVLAALDSPAVEIPTSDAPSMRAVASLVFQNPMSFLEGDPVLGKVAEFSRALAELHEHWVEGHIARAQEIDAMSAVYRNSFWYGRDGGDADAHFRQALDYLGLGEAQADGRGGYSLAEEGREARAACTALSAAAPAAPIVEER